MLSLQSIKSANISPEFVGYYIFQIVSHLFNTVFCCFLLAARRPLGKQNAVVNDVKSLKQKHQRRNYIHDRNFEQSHRLLRRQSAFQTRPIEWSCSEIAGCWLNCTRTVLVKVLNEAKCIGLVDSCSLAQIRCKNEIYVHFLNLDKNPNCNVHET